MNFIFDDELFHDHDIIITSVLILFLNIHKEVKSIQLFMDLLGGIHSVFFIERIISNYVSVYLLLVKAESIYFRD